MDIKIKIFQAKIHLNRCTNYQAWRNKKKMKKEYSKDEIMPVCKTMLECDIIFQCIAKTNG